MSAPEGTPKKLTNKEKHNRESIDKTIKREYDVVTDDDLEEPTEVIERSELNEPSVMVEMTDIPHPGELENPGKPYGSVGAIAYPITAKSKYFPGLMESDVPNFLLSALCV